MNVYRNSEPCIKCGSKELTFLVKAPNLLVTLCSKHLHELSPEKPKGKKKPKVTA